MAQNENKADCALRWGLKAAMLAALGSLTCRSVAMDKRRLDAQYLPLYAEGCVAKYKSHSVSRSSF